MARFSVGWIEALRFKVLRFSIFEIVELVYSVEKGDSLVQ